MRVLSTLKYTFLRMTRSNISLLLLLALPIVYLTLYNFILPNNNKVMFIIFTLSCQMFGSHFAIDYVSADFFTPKIDRIYILPFNKTMYAYFTIFCGTIFNALLGIIILLYLQFILGVNFTNLPWIIFINSLLGVFSSMFSSLCIFSVKKPKTAARMIDIYAFLNMILIDVFIRIPENILVNFINTYINPLSISIKSIFAIYESNLATAWQQVIILLVGIFILFNLTLIIGRRRIK